MSKKLLWLAVLMTSLLVLSSCSNDTTGGYGSGKTYQIGVITALTGSSGEMGQEQKRILDYRVNEWNESSENQIELVYHDGQCEVGAASAAMKTLVEKEHVAFVIGGLCATATFAAVPVTQDQQSIMISATVSNPHLEGLSPNAFSLAFPESDLVREIAGELGKYKKVATLSELGDSSAMLEQDLDDLLAGEYKELAVVYDERFDEEKTELDEYVSAIKDSGADVVFLNPSSEASALAMLQAIDRVGLKIALIGQDTFNRKAVLSSLPASAEGMLIIRPPKVSDASFAPYKAEMEETGLFTHLNDHQIAATLDAIDLLGKLVAENAGDVESVQKALSTGTFSGRTGKIHFGGKAFADNSGALREKIKDNQPVAE